MNRIILALFFLVIYFAQPIYGYLDPGSGSVVVQLILGGVAGVAVILKLYWRKLVALFTSKEGDDQELKSKELQRKAN